MNVDEAMEAAAEFRADMEARPAWTLFSETVAVVLATEVERLRAELAAAKAEIESVIRLGPHPVKQVQMPLATFIRSRMVARWEYNAIIDKLEKAETELAATKAASAVTDEESHNAFAKTLLADGFGSGRHFEYEVAKRREGWDAAVNWLRDRMKEQNHAS